MSFIRVEKRDSVGIITIDRKERFNSLDVETARDLRKAGLSFARDEKVRAVDPPRHPQRLLQRRGSQVHPRRRRRERSGLPEGRVTRSRGHEVFETSQPRNLETRLWRDFQADPRIHPLDHLRDPPRAEAVHRGGRRHRGGGGIRPRDVVRPRDRQRARDVRVGVRQDRPHRRRELDVLPAAAPRLPPRDGAALPQPAPRREAARSTTTSSTASSRSKASTTPS